MLYILNGKFTVNYIFEKHRIASSLYSNMQIDGNIFNDRS